MSDLINTAKEWLSGGEEYRQQQQRDELIKDYEQVDKAAISKLSDGDLAAWQAKYPPGSPHVIFAEHIRKKRLQHQSFWYGALIAIIGTLVGFLIHYIPQHPTKNDTDDKQNPPISQKGPVVPPNIFSSKSHTMP